MSNVIYWMRRDLRLEDNAALSAALKSGHAVTVLFIFDSEILDELPKDDARVSFIHSRLKELNKIMHQYDASMLVKKGKPKEIWKDLLNEISVSEVYANHDYEPYAIRRDQEVVDLLSQRKINFNTFKDQVIFERDEIVKDDGTPYTVFTPYRKKWELNFTEDMAQSKSCDLSNLNKKKFKSIELNDIGFEESNIRIPKYKLDGLEHYKEERDYPAKDSTSHLSPHLRFGTVSIRSVIRHIGMQHPAFLSELIWREFFMQILWHFPRVMGNNFKKKYDAIPWENDPVKFKHWCDGTTGYPIVDAGMRELNQTGLMHNRVRMIVASFLCKHLLIDWRWGEAYFAEKLLDFELSSNNGNWQWAAGTGCDAAPYFRVFNPYEQARKFDPQESYIKKWVPEYQGRQYPEPIVDHKSARQRAIETYKGALNQ